MRLFAMLLFVTVPGYGDWRVLHQKGELEMAAGRMEEAIQTLRKALAEVEGSQKRVVLDALGRVNLGAGNYREARKYLDLAAGLWGDAPAARAVVLSNAGQACQALRQYSLAESRFREALALLPGEAQLWQSLGQVLFLRGRSGEAEEAYRRSLALAGPELTASVWNDLAMVLQTRKEYGKAREALENAIARAAVGQARARMQANLGTVLWKLQEKEAAERALKSALGEMEKAVGAQHPDVARILEDLREVLARTGRKPEAGELAKRAAEIRSLFAGQTNEKGAAVDWRDLR